MNAFARVALTIAALFLCAVLLAAPAPMPARAAAATSTPAPPAIALGVPAGDAQCISGVAVDEARGLAYVMDSDAAGWRYENPGISVVNLEEQEVKRRISLPPGAYNYSEDLLLSPNGNYLYFYSPISQSKVRLDARSGEIVPSAVPVERIAFSDDRRALIVREETLIKVYRTADFFDGKAPRWERRARNDAGFSCAAVSGDRVVACEAEARLKSEAILLDLATGAELARQPLPRRETPVDVVAGPDGGFAVLFGGPVWSRWLARYDADFNLLQKTDLRMSGALVYDAEQRRYLIAGLKASDARRDSPHYLVGLDASNLEKRVETQFGVDSYVRLLIPYRDRIIGYTWGCSAPRLDVFDRQTLQLRNRIPTGVRLADIALDDAAGRLYVADIHYRTHVISVPDGEVLAVWDGGAPLTLDAAHRRLYVNTGAEVHSLDTATGAVVARFPQFGHAAPDATRHVVYIAYRGVTMYDLSGRLLSKLDSSLPVRKISLMSGEQNYAMAVYVNPVNGYLAVLMARDGPYGEPVRALRFYGPMTDIVKYRADAYHLVRDVVLDAAGNWYVSYGFPGMMTAVVKYAPDGAQLARLGAVTGQLAVDNLSRKLYVAQESNDSPYSIKGDARLARLDLSDLSLEKLRSGVPGHKGMALSERLTALYIIDELTSLVRVLPVETAPPADTRPGVRDMGSDQLQRIKVSP